MNDALVQLNLLAVNHIRKEFIVKQSMDGPKPLGMTTQEGTRTYGMAARTYVNILLVSLVSCPLVSA